MSLQIDIQDSFVSFTHQHPSQGEIEIGRYLHTDDFKPYLNPVVTPKGHALTLARPHDHRHHKAVMYSLATNLGNFWEETPSPVHELAGRQKHIEWVQTSENPVGFTEALHWIVDPDVHVFTETREVHVSFDPDQGTDGAYVWSWRTKLNVERECKLIQSVWAHEDENLDFRVNYHGLGIRLRRDMGGLTGGYELEVDGEPLGDRDFTKAMGRVAKSAKYTGCIDGTLPVERASITLTQDHPHDETYGLYTHSLGLQWLSFGPSWKGEVPLTAGDEIHDHYLVTVADEQDRD